MIARENYCRVKEHLQYLEEVLQVKPASAERYWFYLRLLLLWLDDQPLSTAETIRPTFPVFLSQLTGKNGTEPIALEGQKTILECARRFFRWAKQEYSKELNRISPSWIETLRVAPTVAVHPREHLFVTEEEILKLMQVKVPPGDLALERDRAAAGLLFLSGARAAAFTTLPIQAVRIHDQCIDQFPSLGVRTKNLKTATTYLLPIPEILKRIQEWDERVRNELPQSSPWYAIIRNSWGDHQLAPDNPGTNRAKALDKRLRVLYQQAGLPYHSAHKFRHGHAVYALLRAKTPADFKAISINLMHSGTRVTDEMYAFLSAGEIRERILRLSLATAPSTLEMDALIRQSIHDGIHREIEALAQLLAG